MSDSSNLAKSDTNSHSYTCSEVLNFAVILQVTNLIIYKLSYNLSEIIKC